MDAAAAAYGQSETQKKVTRLERERQRRYHFLNATAARPPAPPLTPTEREVKWEESRRWLRGLNADPSAFYGSGGFVVGQGYIPKAAALAYGRVVAEASKLFEGAPGSDTYTDGVKLFCLRDALIFAPVQEGLPYGAEIKRRCLLFLDGGLQELYDTVLVRRTARQPQTYSAADCEQLLRDEVAKRRKGGDVRGMVDVLERSLDPPPPAPLIDPVAKFNSLLFKPGEPADKDDPNSHIRPPLPDERREPGTTTPPASLEALKKAAWGKKNSMVGAGPSGSSFRLVYVAFHLEDELASQRYADLANYMVANLLSDVARDLITTKRGALILKAGQSEADQPTRPIGVGECFIRVVLTVHVVIMRRIYLEVQKELGQARVQLGVGIPNGCAVAAVDFNVYLRRIQNAIFVKGDARSAFQAPDRAPTYDTLLTSPPKLRVFCSMWFFLYGRASVILFCTYAVVGGYVVLLSCVGVIQGCTCGSDFFAIAIQAVAARVNREIPNQITRLIVDDVGSCGEPEAVRAAHELFNLEAAKLGVASHSGKRVVVAGTANVEALERMDFGGAEIVHGVIFAGLPIACVTTEGGRAFIDEYCNEKVAHIRLLCRRLMSLDRLQDAYTILSRSISRKLVHLQAWRPSVHALPTVGEAESGATECGPIKEHQ